MLLRRLQRDRIQRRGLRWQRTYDRIQNVNVLFKMFDVEATASFMLDVEATASFVRVRC